MRSILQKGFFGKFKADPLPKYKKLGVIEYGLDHWIAQQYNLNIENYPSKASSRPSTPLYILNYLEGGF